MILAMFSLTDFVSNGVSDRILFCMFPWTEYAVTMCFFDFIGFLKRPIHAQSIVRAAIKVNDFTSRVIYL